jgi:hypothetical protein
LQTGNICIKKNRTDQPNSSQTQLHTSLTTKQIPASPSSSLPCEIRESSFGFPSSSQTRNSPEHPNVHVHVPTCRRPPTITATIENDHITHHDHIWKPRNHDCPSNRNSSFRTKKFETRQLLPSKNSPTADHHIAVTPCRPHPWNTTTKLTNLLRCARFRSHIGDENLTVSTSSTTGAKTLFSQNPNNSFNRKIHLNFSHNLQHSYKLPSRIHH